MTANDKTKAVENFQNLTNFIEGNYGELTYFKENGYNEGEDYHLILDGNYHIEAKTKYEHIPLKRVVCLKGKNQDDDKQPMLYFRNNAGFGINEDGGMVAENIQFEDDENLGKV